MKRLHLFEIEDQAWCPPTVRDALTDYLQFALVAMKPYAAMVPLLADAVYQRQGIGVFEAGQRSLLAIMLTLLAPLVLLVVTPLIRPFRWSRLLWTYLIPLVPMVTLFDGLVSCLRIYSVQELKD